MGEAEVTGLLVFRIVLACVLVERAVAQIKFMKRTVEARKPWAVIAFIMSFMIVYGYDLQMIAGLIRFAGEPLFIDTVISSLTMAGGAAGFVSALKKAKEKTAEATGVKAA